MFIAPSDLSPLIREKIEALRSVSTNIAIDIIAGNCLCSFGNFNAFF